MPSEAYEESVDLTIGLLEAEAPDPDRPDIHAPSYPLPRLSLSGGTDVRTFRAVCLENPFLKATFIPALGGRLLKLLDKRTDIEILPLGDLAPTPGGIRGVELPQGLQIRAMRNFDRPNAMGPVLFQIEEGDDESPATVWFGEVGPGSGLGLTWRFSLPARRTELRMEVRAFNRGFEPLPYDPAVTVAVGSNAYRLTEGGIAAYDFSRRAGVSLWPEDEPMDSAFFADGVLGMCRFAQGLDKALGPRQLDIWAATLSPLSGLEDVRAISQEAALSLANGVCVQTVERRSEHRILLLDAAGQTLEATADLAPESLFQVSMPASPQSLVIRDSRHIEILRFDSELEPLEFWSAVVADASPPAALPRSLPNIALRRASFEPALRALAHLFLGMNLLAVGAPERAGREFESSLLYNAEDHLAWWAKAVAVRLTTEADQERPELLNAHYLAPLEPALRAEGFLSQPMTMGKEPSPLLKPLEETPEAFVEVACLLIDCELWDQAARWIDEALRHQELHMLRYLLAYCHLKGNGLAFESAKEVQAASKHPLAPPYPWRAVELQAIENLETAFPEDANLRTARSLMRLLAQQPGRTS